jgi:hypothetical protein
MGTWTRPNDKSSIVKGGISFNIGDLSAAGLDPFSNIPSAVLAAVSRNNKAKNAFNVNPLAVGTRPEDTYQDNSVDTSGTFATFGNEGPSTNTANTGAAVAANTNTNAVSNAATDIYNNNNNTNARGVTVNGQDAGITITGSDADIAAGAATGPQTIDQQVQDLMNSGQTPTQVIDGIADIYGDDQAGAQNVILGEANTRDMTAEDLAGIYDPDGDGQGFPIDVLIQILRGMPDNQDAVDILSRSTLPTLDNTATGTPGTAAPGTAAPGTAAPGTAAPGTAAPGTAAPGTAAPGAAGPGTEGPGAAGPGTAGPGTAGPGTAGPGTAGPGTAGPGTDTPNVNDLPPGGINDLPPGGTGGVSVGGGTPPGVGLNTSGGGMSFSDLFSSSNIIEDTTDPLFREGASSLLGTNDVSNNLINRLNTGYNRYTGDRFTDLNADQLNVADRIRSNIDAIPGADIFSEGVNASRNVGNINVDPITGASVNTQMAPMQKAGRDKIQDIVAGQFAGTNLDPYMNPYTDAVINTTLKDIERARQMQNLQNDSAASMAGAYGGDRAALVNAETNRASQDLAARTIADLRNRGFEAAADLYAKDADRSMDAQDANQKADIQTVRDAMLLAQDSERQNQTANRLADSQNELNQLRASTNLINAFSTGSDVYGDYLGDYANLADSLDARDQREKDFDFNEFLASQDYDQDMIDNMIRLFQTAPRNRRQETTVDRGLAGDLQTAVSSFDDIGDIYDRIKRIGDDNKLFG